MAVQYFCAKCGAAVRIVEGEHGEQAVERTCEHDDATVVARAAATVTGKGEAS